MKHSRQSYAQQLINSLVIFENGHEDDEVALVHNDTNSLKIMVKPESKSSEKDFIAGDLESLLPVIQKQVIK